MNRVTGALQQLRRLYTEALYSRVGSIDRDTQDTEQPGLLGYPGHIGELGFPGHIGKLGYPGNIGELGYPDT